MGNIRCLIRLQRIPRHLLYPQLVPIAKRKPLLSGSKKKKSSRLMSRDLIWWDPRRRKSEICQTRRSTSVLALVSHVRYIQTYLCRNLSRVRVGPLHTDRFLTQISWKMEDRTSKVYTLTHMQVLQGGLKQTRSMRVAHLVIPRIKILIPARQT